MKLDYNVSENEARSVMTPGPTAQHRALINGFLGSEKLVAKIVGDPTPTRTAARLRNCVTQSYKGLIKVSVRGDCIYLIRKDMEP